MENTFQGVCRELLTATEGCRPDMHEPDEQDISVRVIGDHLDNACGTEIREGDIIHGYQEIVVLLKRAGSLYRFNLADLIALARMAAAKLLADE